MSNRLRKSVGSVRSDNSVGLRAVGLPRSTEESIRKLQTLEVELDRMVLEQKQADRGRMIKEQKRWIKEQKRLQLDLERVETELTVESKATPIIPLALLVVVASFVLGADHFRTLGNLSAVCRWVRQSLVSHICETIVYLPPHPADPGYFEKGVAFRAFIEREARHVKYLVLNNSSTILLSPMNDLRSTVVSVLRQKGVSQISTGPVNPKGTVSVVVRGTVSVSTLTRLIRLSSKIIASEASIGTYSQQSILPPSLKVLQLTERGRMVGCQERSDCPWSIADKTYLILQQEDRGFTQGRLESMQYIYKGVSPVTQVDDAWEPSPHDIGLKISLYGSPSGFHTFIDSLPALWKRDPGIIPSLTLESGQVTVDNVTKTFSTIAGIYAEHGRRIPPLWRGVPFFGLFTVQLSIDVEPLMVWATENSTKKDALEFTLLLGVNNQKNQKGSQRRPMHVETFTRFGDRSVQV